MQRYFGGAQLAIDPTVRSGQVTVLLGRSFDHGGGTAEPAHHPAATGF